MNYRGSTFRCAICWEVKFSSSYRIPQAANGCHGHDEFCKECVAKHIGTRIEEGNALVMCPWRGHERGDNCKQAFSPMACREFVTGEVFNKWCDLLCESAVRGYERCYCPNKECQELIVDECIGSSEPRKIRCPRCRKRCCFKCAGPWEDGQHDHGCDEVHVFVETKDWKRCPGCKNYVERNKGCWYISCRCQTQLCYRCGRKTNNHICSCEKSRGDSRRRSRIALLIAFIVSLIVVSLFMYPLEIWLMSSKNHNVRAD